MLNKKAFIAAAALLALIAMPHLASCSGSRTEWLMTSMRISSESYVITSRVTLVLEKDGTCALTGPGFRSSGTYTRTTGGYSVEIEGFEPLECEVEGETMTSSGEGGTLMRFTLSKDAR